MCLKLYNDMGEKRKRVKSFKKEYRNENIITTYRESLDILCCCVVFEVVTSEEGAISDKKYLIINADGFNQAMYLRISPLHNRSEKVCYFEGEVLIFFYTETKRL